MIATFRLPIFDPHRLLTMAAFRRYNAAWIIPVIPALFWSYRLILQTGTMQYKIYNTVILFALPSNLLVSVIVLGLA
jgi:hypothetical protein